MLPPPHTVPSSAVVQEEPTAGGVQQGPVHGTAAVPEPAPPGGTLGYGVVPDEAPMFAPLVFGETLAASLPLSASADGLALAPSSALLLHAVSNASNIPVKTESSAYSDASMS